MFFFRFGSLDIWPHRKTFIENMPESNTKDFPNTPRLVIIDSTELTVQKPSSLHRQSQRYSDYKSSTTLKGLVKVDPRGSIIFVSMLFTGSISDKDITEESGFRKLLSDPNIQSGTYRMGMG